MYQHIESKDWLFYRNLLERTIYREKSYPIGRIYQTLYSPMLCSGLVRSPQKSAHILTRVIHETPSFLNLNAERSSFQCKGLLFRSHRIKVDNTRNVGMMIHFWANDSCYTRFLTYQKLKIANYFF